MAIPLAPLGLAALRLGAGAALVYAIARARRSPADIHREHAMDNTPEGVDLSADKGRADGSLRWRRTVRAGANGPGFEIDAAALARFRIRRV